jgi:hypothetical protein
MSLSLYSPGQEENLFILRQADTWRRSDLMTEEQLRHIQTSVTSDLRQTNLFFRILFFTFTFLCAGTITGLSIWLMENSGGPVLAAMLIFSGSIYYIAAEFIISKKQFYRYGIEEALAVIAMILVCAGCGWLLNEMILTSGQAFKTALVLLALFGCWIYLRFGYLYTALIGVLALCAIPFQFSLPSTVERLLLLGILCSAFLLGLLDDTKAAEDFKKERSAWMLTCLLAAIYLAVNLHIFGVIGWLAGQTGITHFRPESFPPFIYWSSYALTFLIPAAALYRGMKSRRRFILNAGLLMALATLVTNKSYLGMTRYAWDPAILGVVMIGVFFLLTRWLNSGSDQKRFGFTVREILKPKETGISLTDAASALTPGTQENMQSPHARPSEPDLEGGASGGGGAQRNY